MALEIWHNEEVYNGILIHIDAHLDYVSLKESYYINIGNYLAHAVSKNFFKKVYWVVPDILWKNSIYTKMIISQLPRCFEVIDIDEKVIKLKNTEFPHSEFVVIGISDTKLNIDGFLLDEFVCVDIDIDYMMNPIVSQNYSYGYPAKNWCTAYDLYSKFAPLMKKRHIVTIANSLYGGYTPLLYAYLSEYLRDLFCYEKGKKYDDFELLENGANLLVKGDYTEAIKCYKKVRGPFLSFLSAQIGLLYSYVSTEHIFEAQKVYSLLETHYKNYEAYYFPVSILLFNNQIDLAKTAIEQWLNISSLCEQANLFILKYASFTMDIQNESKIEKYACKITDWGTDYEKSYVLGNIYLQRFEYQKSIDSYNSVLLFLRNNSTPVWCGQISSFEKYKNHGVIISDIYEKLMNAYVGLKDYKIAIKYAKICKKMGRYSSKIEQILSC